MNKTLASESEYLLLTPGPTPVPESIRREMAKPLFHHRTPEFARILMDVHEKLKSVFQTQAGEIFLLAGSGTAAMEAAVVNFFSPGQKVIVCSIGAFGDRWASIAKAHGLEVELLKEEMGYPVNLERLKKTLDSNPDAAGVFVQHLDTSSATVNPVADIGALVKNREAILLVDSVSGLAGEPMLQDLWGVDVCVSAAQKGLMCPPGVAMLSVSPKAAKRMESSKMARFYFDLRKYRKSRDQDKEMPFTAPISLIMGLAKALEEMEQEGLEARLERYSETALWVREQIKSRLGCKLFSQSPSRVLTAAWMPEGRFKEGVTSSTVLKYIRDQYRITIADGQNELKGRIFRIAHMGAITKENTARGLDALAEAFEKFSR